MVSIDRRQYLDGASTISWNGSGRLETRSVFERYNIVSDGDLKDAARKLDVVAPAGR